MKLQTLLYCLKQGFLNIRRNRLFSLASIVTIAACIFLFGIFYSIVTNIGHMAREMESTVGITVFFEQGLSESRIEEIGSQIHSRSEVESVVYVSAEEAWETYKQKYFADNPELAEGFSENPLANSASYQIYLHSTEDQPAVVAWLKQLSGIRKVNYSEAAAGGLSSMNNLVSYISIGIIAILLVVSLLLISNTISLAYAVRREEVEVVKWIGATNAFVRAPFVVEGLLIGLIGAALPLIALYYLYEKTVRMVMSRFGILSNLLTFLPAGTVFRVLVPVALLLGAGIGFCGSFFTIRRQLKV